MFAPSSLLTFVKSVACRRRQASLRLYPTFDCSSRSLHVTPSSSWKMSAMALNTCKFVAHRGAASLRSRSSGGFSAGKAVWCQTPVRTFRATTVTCMALKTGIVGLPNVGKSTLFNALVENSTAEAANYPFCTIEPNSGIVPVPDERLQALALISGTTNIVPTTCEFVDIAGLVKGAADGAGLGNKFLANIRECDAVVHVVRCFDDDDVIHVDGRVDPLSDIFVINCELALADMAQIERRLERLGKGRAKSTEEKASELVEREVLAKLSANLNEGKPARLVDLKPDEWALVKDLMLLTAKPCVYAANVNEGDLADNGESNEYVRIVRKHAAEEGSVVTIISAQVESELIKLDVEEREEFLADLGATEGGLKSLIRNAYSLLGLQTYFTTGEKETRAWTIKKGFTAPQAAGVIHGDFEKGFIKAETVGYDDFIANGGFAGAKTNGVWRLEGKEYVVKEGDVLVFKFNV